MTIYIADAVYHKEGERVFYGGWIRAADVFDAVFVPVERKTRLPKKKGKNFAQALEERDQGYQRCASRSRQNEIAKYCIQHPQAIIPPVLLSDRGVWKWTPIGNGPLGALEITEKAAVVDGQHRLGGFRLQALESGGSPDRRIQFVAVANLTPQEEQAEFIKINTTQKGVPKAQIASLEAHKWWNAVGIALNEGGPFAGRIQAAGGVRDPWHTDLKLHSVANAIFTVFGGPKGKPDPWGFQDDEERKDEIPELLTRYWELVSEAFADEWNDLDLLPYPEELGGGGGDKTTRDFEFKLLELTGYLAWMWFLEKYAGSVWNSNTRTLNETELLKYLTWIREAEEPNPEYGKRPEEPQFRKIVDWRKKGKFEGRTGGAGAKPIVDAMVGVVQDRLSGVDNS